MGIHHCRRIGGHLHYLLELSPRNRVSPYRSLQGGRSTVRRILAVRVSELRGSERCPVIGQSYPLFFQILAHFFARNENSTLFFSSVSALFGKNRGLGYLFLVSSLPRLFGERIREVSAKSLLRYLLTSLPPTRLLPCFLTSLQYNLSAFIRG